MRNILTIALCVIIAASFKASAQDTIIQLDGTKVLSTILSVNDDYIIYKMPDSSSKHTYIMQKDGISRIDYKDGKSIVFNNPLSHSMEDTDMERNGYLDAVRHYHTPAGARAGAFLGATFTTPVGGLIPAITASATPPSDETLNYPDSVLMQNEVYAESYRRTAAHKKKRRVWRSWAVGSLINLSAIAVAVTVYSITQIPEY